MISLKEPVPNTCDTIDKIIETLEDVCEILVAVKEEIKHSKLTIDEKLEIMENLISTKIILENLSNGDLSPLETIRHANDMLRTWGNDLAEEYKDISIKKKK